MCIANPFWLNKDADGEYLVGGIALLSGTILVLR
jgi:hypothetical protein